MLELTNLETIKKVLKDNNLFAKKGYGQNFLVNKKILDKILDNSEITKNDTIIEIGPGLGVLTQELAKRAKLVLAIESDFKMAEYLRVYFKNVDNIKIIHQDALTFSLDLIETGYKLISNLPYNITSPVIRKFLESQTSADLNMDIDHRGIKESKSNLNSNLKLMVLMVQREVAERLTAKPGNSDRGILTVMVELYGGTEMVEIVSKDCFYPVPSVDSAIIKIRVDPRLICVDPRLLMKFVKIGFSQKRRQIHHPLASNLHLSKDQIYDILKAVNIDPTLRAEALYIEDWIRLYNQINSNF